MNQTEPNVTKIIVDTLKRLCTIPSFGVFHKTAIVHINRVKQQNTRDNKPIILIIFSILFFVLQFINYSSDPTAISN